MIDSRYFRLLGCRSDFRNLHLFRWKCLLLLSFRSIAFAEKRNLQLFRLLIP
jgi:hypothetical protein